MTWHDLGDGGGVLELDESLISGVSLELELVVDLDEGLAWGVWWLDGSEMLFVVPAASA